MSNPHLTVGETARLYDVAQWRIRKIVDELDADIPRAGMYRLIPRHLLPTIAIKLQERGWLPSAEETAVY